ncbi:serine/threonine-protein kinase [Actinomadura rudentiformis]|uniref:serine/threonine-protein kinase n=1 Tax=Actinomadura rudentiformis TaxID=359158 RepID=UPI00178C2DC1|nr:serine/threonine-protein kinase [Actinomadura rudentiformis]
MVDGWTVPGFTHVRDLGSGSSGRVVLAVDDLTQTKVAIKYLDRRLRGDDAFLSDFRTTAQRLSQLEDPNVVDFYDFVETPEGAAVVMERVNGVSMRWMLAAQGPTGPLAALAMLGGILAGLAAGHDRGVVHGAVRPANVIVDGAGNGRLTDFGLAPAASIAQSGPAYAAPELWNGAPASVATDLYAATAIFFECLTGRPPFSARSQSGLAKAHREAAIPVEEVPGPLRDLIARGLAKDPAERPKTAADMLGAVEEAAVAAYGLSWEAQGRSRLTELAAQTAERPEPKPSRITTPRGNPISQPVRSSRSRLVAALVAGVVIIGGVLGAAVVHASQDEDAPRPDPSPAGSGSPAPASPGATPGATLADKVSKATAETPGASFSYRRSGCCGGPAWAQGSFRIVQGAAPSYSMTVSASTKALRKRTRAVLVGGSAYVQAGKRWQNASLAGGGRGYAALAGQVRAGSAAGNVAALLQATTSLQEAGGIYRGTVPVSALTQSPELTQLASAVKAKQVQFALRLDRNGLPVQIRIKVGQGGRSQLLQTSYSNWGKAGSINAPQ